MSKKKEEFEGLGYGPGVDPIPTPEHESVSSTDMLEEVVDEMLNDTKNDNDKKNNNKHQ